MPLQFITGNSGAGKSTTAYEALIRRSMEHPERNYIVLVPEQFTMQTQRELVTLHPAHGIFNIDILSFQRLAFRIFEETGGSPYPLLEETGKSLVLERVAQEQKKNLTILAQSLKKPGTVSSMKSVVSELKQYCISPEQLKNWAGEQAHRPLLAAKLHDIEVIYTAFEEYLASRYLTAEDVLTVLAERIPESLLLGRTELLVDGFTGFTPVQIQVLTALMKACLQVEVTVILDEREDLYAPYRSHQLFAMSRLMGHQLVQAAKTVGCEILPVIQVQRSKQGRFLPGSPLDFLEQNLFRFSKQGWRGPQEAVHLHQMPSPREELEYAARMIRRSVRTRGLRYRDFAVLCGDLSIYGSLAEEIFRKAQIPVFLDRKRSILTNPFAELIRSACDLVVSGYSYESVFRYLRCGFSSLSRDEIDRMENYCLALGIRGYEKYKETWTRHSRNISPEEVPELNRLRKRFLKETGAFYETFHQKDASVLERTRALYELIARQDIERKLEEMADAFEVRGDMALAGEYRQIYRIVISLLEKYAEVLGDEILHYNEYQQILEAGLGECSVGVIPPTTDQVLIGDNERTRLKDIRVLFFLGVNDGMIPKQAGSGGILSDHDREELEKQEIVLSPDARTEMYMQRFHLYRNLTRPSEELHLSYAVTGVNGDAQSPSYLIRTMMGLFPELPVEIQDEKELSDMDWLETQHSGIPLLLQGLKEAAEGEIRPEFLELFRYYRDNPMAQAPVHTYLEAAFTHCPPGVIGRAVAAALYGATISGSPTRLEKYAACAFAHFLNYGLQLKERERYEFKASDFGNILHEALELFAKKLAERNLTWSRLDAQVSTELVQECLDEVLGDYGNTILERSSRDRYQKERIRRLMLRTVWALQKQLEAGDFEPGGFEVAFAGEEELKSMNIELTEGETLRMRGRIDRVDRCETSDHVYVKIVDYKTGNTSLDLVSLYHGLQIQLLVYLDAALEQEEQLHPEKQVEPAGIFYYHIEDPMLDKKDESEQERQERLLASLKPGGLVNSDPEILARLDRKLLPGIASGVIPVTLSKDGSLSSRGSKTASGAEFQILREYTRKKAGELGCGILNGNVQIAPYQLGKETPCAWCAYRHVCSFDRKVPGYEYRNLKAIDKAQVFEEMKKKME